MHPLLARQLKRLGLDGEHPVPSPAVWGELLERISRSYLEADQGHALLERSLALSSEEMRNLYAQLKQSSETQLAQERNKLQAVLHALGDGLCVVDAAWKIQMMNQQAELLFGESAQALLGRPVYRMISPGPEEYREECLITDATLPALASGEPYRTDDGLLVTAAGQLIAISLVVTPMTSDGVVIGAVLVFRDITVQKQVERERQQTEGVLRRIQAGLSELAKSPQVYSGNLQDAFQTVTRVAAECLHTERVSIWFFTGGRSAVQCANLYQLATREHSQGLALSASDYPRYFGELDTERVVAADDAQTDSRTAEFTTGYLAPLGITSMLDVPIRSEGKMIGVICHEHIGPKRRWTLEEQQFAASVANTVALAIEAADRRKVEQALRTSEGRLTTTVQSTNIGIWDWDLNSNNVYLSPEWKRQLGYEDHELDNTFQEWESRIHPEDHDRSLGAIEAYLSGHVSVLEIEHRLRHKDDSYRWILARGTMIKNEEELSSRIVGIHIDVTDRKTAEELLRQAKETAEAASLAKSQFLANMSHEIRTPMNGVLGMAELLLRFPLGAKERHLTQSIHRSGTVLLAIINDILDFSKIEAGKLQLEATPFEVRRTIQDAIDVPGPAAEKKHLKISWTMDEKIPLYLLGDPTRLRQVLVNLVGNAVKFTERGQIEVAVMLERQKGEQYGLSVSVQDTGIGISPEAQTHIFEAFSQADGSTTRKYGGTGLGLAIVKQLVTLMGGAIELRSSPGEGSRFRFTAHFERCNPVERLLPPPALQSIGHSEPADHRPPSLADVRILLVEDNPVNREVACGMLEVLNCRIDTAENGREAVTALETTEYALVFMDCQMPEMDGFTATRLIREREANVKQSANNTADCPKRRVPIVALTAHAMQGDRELCLAAGMDDYLTKPFTLAQLEHIVTRWIFQKDTTTIDGDSASATPPEKPIGGDQPSVVSREGKHNGITVEPAIIDQSALAAIRALQRPGHPDIVARIVSQYVETSREMVERIRRAVLVKDAVELRAAAHRLKSSSAQLGASALAADCRELEMMGASQELERAGDVLSRFEQHYEAACAALHEELTKGRSAA
ncbi:MAG: ATP-binding protein [Nitrospira sp.]|nr:ATP-binding protein [Nitrospira sp.]MDH4368230.1 ATP-binding protein [Nitrospira sp.]MDH5347938.1 ATP-binding protein [Nitrospira sp.]MDH5495862.1 ATP-binding protein [Nitrospira sp.]MDH5724301.1 ATP-binding protein [Nitrospira sp.]